MMYELGTQRDFIARHFLIGGDFGAENLEHSHPYRLEVILSAAELDGHGYLIDLLELERAVDHVLGLYRDQLLNELPAFRGLNPSLEHFARILWGALIEQWSDPRIELRVMLWENERDWAGYRGDSARLKA